MAKQPESETGNQPQPDPQPESAPDKPETPKPWLVGPLKRLPMD